MQGQAAVGLALFVGVEASQHRGPFVLHLVQQGLDLGAPGAFDHVEQVEIDAPGRDLEKRTDVAENVQHVEVGIHHHAGRHVSLEGRVDKARFHRALPPDRGAADRRQVHAEWHESRGAGGQLLAAEQLVLAADRLEKPLALIDAFRFAQEQQATAGKRVVEGVEYFFLQVVLEVDQQIAAADQVEPQEGGILQDVLTGKDDRFAQWLDDFVGG